MNLLVQQPLRVFENTRELSALGADRRSQRQLARNKFQANLKRVHHGWSQVANRLIGSKPTTVQLRLPGSAEITSFSYRPGTTDLLVLEQVFLDREYDVDPIAPEDIHYILDLGSNIGVTAMLWAQRYPAARMILVEPDPDNFALLQKNTAAFRGRCTLVNAAVSDTCGHTTFFRSEREYGHSIIKGDDSVSELRVETFTVPALLRQAGFPRVDLLKMDIEGGEELVMPTIAQWGMGVRYLIAELHPPYGLDTFAIHCEQGGLDAGSDGTRGFIRNLPFAVSKSVQPAFA